jgi:hypothetical protein
MGSSSVPSTSPFILAPSLCGAALTLPMSFLVLASFSLILKAARVLRPSAHFPRISALFAFLCEKRSPACSTPPDATGFPV